MRYGLDSNVSRIFDEIDKIQDCVNDKMETYVHDCRGEVLNRKFHYVNVIQFFDKVRVRGKLLENHIYLESTVVYK